MSFVVLMIAVSPVVCNFFGFIIGKQGDEFLRSRLLNFYIAVHGDWTQAYRAPAQLVARYLRASFGGRVLLFPIYLAFFSVITTSLLTMAHLNLTIPNGVDSAGPILTGQGYFDVYGFLEMYVFPNLIGDLICWPICLLIFSYLARSNPLVASLLVVAMFLISIVSFVIIARLQRSDLGSLKYFNFSYPFAHDGSGVSDDWIALSSALNEIGMPTDQFTFDYWGAVPLAVFLPAIILGVTTAVSILLVVFRPVIRRPLIAVLERLDGSDKRVMNQLSAFLLGLAVIFTALRVFLA
jgi:hypothetical protein